MAPSHLFSYRCSDLGPPLHISGWRAFVLAFVCAMAAASPLGQTSSFAQDIDESASLGKPLFLESITHVSGACFDEQHNFYARSFTAKGNVHQIEVSSLRTGKLVKRFQTPYVASVGLLASDASSITLYRQVQGKLAVWDIQGEPKETMELDVGRQWKRNKSAYRKTYLGYAGPNRFINVTLQEVEVWDPRTGKQLAKHSTQRPEKFARIYPPFRLTANAEHLYFAASSDTQTMPPVETRLRMLKLEDGTISEMPKFETGVPADEPAVVSNYSVSPDGSKVVGVCAEVADRWLGVWDLESGKRIAKIRPYGVFASVGDWNWLNEQFFLSQGVIYSVPRQEPLALYQVPATKGPASSRFPSWQPQLVPNSNSIVRSKFCTKGLAYYKVPFLSEETLEKLAGIEPKLFFHAKGGAEVRLMVEVDSPSPIPKIAQSFYDTISENLGEAGYKVVDESDILLHAYLKAHRTGKTLQVKMSRTEDKSGVQKVEEVRTECLFRMTDAEGNEFLRRTLTGKTVGRLEIENGESVKKAALKMHWKNVLETASKTKFKSDYVKIELDTIKDFQDIDPKWVAEHEGAIIEAKETEVAKENFERSERYPHVLKMPNSRSNEPRKWEVKTFGLPEFAARTARRPISIGDLESVTNVSVKFASIKTQQVLVSHQVRNETKRQTIIKRFDLKTGKLLSRVELPYQAQLLDFRPDGKFWLISNPEIPHAYEIWESTEDKKSNDRLLSQVNWGKSQSGLIDAQFTGRDHVLALQTLGLEPDEKAPDFMKPQRNRRFPPILPPYGSEESRATLGNAGMRVSNGNAGSMRGSGMRSMRGGMGSMRGGLGSMRGAAKEGRNTLVSRSFDSDKPSFVKHTFSSTICLSPGRKYFADVDQDHMAMFSTSDSTLAGRLEKSNATTFGTQTKGLHLAHIRSDGKRLVASRAAGPHALAQQWDLETGAFLGDVPSQSTSGFNLDGDLIFCNHSLFHYPTMSPVCSYSTSRTKLEKHSKGIVHAGGDSYWHIDKGNGKKNSEELCLYRMPFKDFKKIEKAVAANLDRNVIAPNAIDIEINVSNARTDQFEGKLMDAIKSRLEKDGLEYDDNAETKLVVNVVFTPHPDIEKSRNKLGLKSVLSFQNDTNDKYFRVYDYHVHAGFDIYSTQGTCSLGRTSTRLSALPYTIDWDATDPQRDFENQFAASAATLLAEKPWKDTWLPDKFANPIGDTDISIGEEKFVLNEFGESVISKKRKKR